MGGEVVRGHYEELLKSFPDLGIEVKERRQTEDAVILEVIVSGTHTGQWRNLPPLGRKMASRVCAIYTFDSDGLIECERTYDDKAIVLEQLGIFKDPRTPLKLVIPPRTPHGFKDAAEEAQLLVEARPALHLDDYFRTFLGLSRDGASACRRKACRTRSFRSRW